MTSCRSRPSSFDSSSGGRWFAISLLSLVLVHGLGGAASNWRDLAPLLARRRRVLVPELPGHGGSSPLPAAPSMSPYSDRALAVAEHESMLPAPFVGHSMGG